MDLYNVCSESMQARGFNYYKKKLVKELTKINDNEYKAKVSGNENYDVTIYLNNIKKSKCTCPYNRGICKHIVATYFELKPLKAIHYEQSIKRMINEHKQYQKNKKNQYVAVYNEAVKYVNSLSIEELKKQLISKIIDENYYDNLNEYDNYCEEEYELLDELDEDVLELLEDDHLKYPIHNIQKYVNAFEKINGEDSWIDINTCEVYDELVFEALDLDEEEVSQFIHQPFVYKLPGQLELDRIGIIKLFINTIDEKNIKNRLKNSMNCLNPISNFNSELKKLNFLDEWLKFENNVLKQKVISWLEKNEIKYEIIKI